MATTEVLPRASLHELLAIHDHPSAVDDVRRIAALQGGLDEKGVTVLGRAIDDWSVANAASDLEKAFALDPFVMMAKGWTQVSNVRKAVKTSLGPPPVAATAALLKHEIDVKVKPRLVLSVDGVDWCDVDFEVRLALAIDSAELELYGGGLRAIKLGKVGGSVTVSCRGTPIPSFKRELKFRPQYTFDPPILAPT